MRSARGCWGGLVQEKRSRERCRSWTVLHAQCTSGLSSGFPVSQGNAEALDRWGGIAKHRLISLFVSNTSAKNCHNRIVYVKIIASQRWDVFWETVYVLRRRRLVRILCVSLACYSCRVVLVVVVVVDANVVVALTAECHTCAKQRCTVRTSLTRMWANAQRDGRPAEYRWHPLFNAAKCR